MTTTYPRETVDGFVEVSRLLTGFETFELYGTGMAELYLETMIDQVGEAAYQEFVFALDRADRDPEKIQDEVAQDIARAVTHLWYLGVWPQLSASAHGKLRREKPNVAFTAAPEAYVEGLVWRTFHGHPPGAKPPGFGTWAAPPPGAPEIPAPQQQAGGTS
ncbi:hypothetical protein GCM10010193_04170 [Kitasatospora atroaurantiaca]|uniref:Uncharacterized protein n=1 Tax=Kitasatospora atroaurantiaca TaxID=285545 RepID=A0A561ELY4_9ACTN|nr:hypothetical protein [Kitasatospora atroaurantiaca]TWE16635.1 hypothetical protein FB465_1618 [Kitasatospora atroaurantiaca]